MHIHGLRFALKSAYHVEVPPNSRHAALASELIRGLRGRRSQTALSRRLGYRSNIVHRWEAGNCWPTAARFLSLCTRVGVDLEVSFTRFYGGRRPAWLKDRRLATSQTVVYLLTYMRGRTPIKTVAALAGMNRFAVSRWLRRRAEPRLPEFLALIEAISRRLVDFISVLTDPATLPSLAREAAELTRARELAYASPWSHATLRAMELAEHATLDFRDADDEVAWFASVLGIDRASVQHALEALENTGQIQRRRGRRVLHRVLDVNTGRDLERARQVKATWTAAALERLRAGSAGLFGYSLFAISRADLQRLREVQLEYVREMQSIISQSRAPECVGLYAVQLLDLSVPERNALRADE